MIDTIYLQRDTNGKVALAVKANRCEEFPFDYYTLETVSNKITFAKLNSLVKEKYQCKKLIIQF